MVLKGYFACEDALCLNEKEQLSVRFIIEEYDATWLIIP